MKLKRIFRSVLRLAPTFALISIVGCVIGYFVFRIPHGELGVVVSVPIVVAFIVTRLLILLVPRKTPEEEPGPATPRLISVLVFFVGVVVATIMLPSAAIYMIIGLPEVAKGALLLGNWSVTVALVVLIVDIVVTLVLALPIRDLIDFTLEKTVEFFWDALRAPTLLAMRIYGQFGNPMANIH